MTDPVKKPFKDGHPRLLLVWVLGIAGLFMAALTLFLAIILLVQPNWYSTKENWIKAGLAVCGFIWCVGPPIWFWWEYHNYFLEEGDPEGFDSFKYSQQLSIAVWAGLVVFFGIVLAMAN